MTSYIGRSPSLGMKRNFVFEPSPGTTTIAGSDANGLLLQYSRKNVDVFLNGLLLERGVGRDYTADDGLNIVLSAPTPSGAIVSVQTYGAGAPEQAYTDADLATPQQILDAIAGNPADGVLANLSQLHQIIAATAGSGFKGLQVITVSSTYTPTAGAQTGFAFVIAPGGAGGGCLLNGNDDGAGGGAGECRLISLPSLSEQSVTIGAQAIGTVPTSGSEPGADGGDTVFGALVTSKGGLGGGGAASNSRPNYRTVFGSGGLEMLSTDGNFASNRGGAGGRTIFGNQGREEPTSAEPGRSATGFGAGGSGSYNGTSHPAVTGGSGAPGAVIVFEFG